MSSLCSVFGGRGLCRAMVVIFALSMVSSGCKSSGSSSTSNASKQSPPSVVVGAAISSSQAGAIAGTVTHEGAPLPGATVRVSSPALTGTRVAVSNVNGDYAFISLPAGPYTISFELEGMGTVTRTAEVVVGKTSRVPAALGLAAVTEAITVAAAAPAAMEGTEVRANLPDFGRSRPVQKRAAKPKQEPIRVTSAAPSVLQTTEVSSNYTASRIESLPVTRNMTNGATAVPPRPGMVVQAPAARENYLRAVESSFHRASEEPISTFSIDTDRAAYSNVRRFLNFGSLPPADAVRVEELINYFEYTYPQPTDGTPFSITTEIADCPWSPTNKLLRVGVQGKTVRPDEIPPGNLVFLVDVSGSMSTPDKLPLVRASLKKLVAQLRDEDRVAIVVYAGAAGLVLPSTSGRDKWAIERAIDNMQAGGSTAGGQGILLAYQVAADNYLKDGNNRVILATDGDFNVGPMLVEELQQLIESKRSEGVFLSVLGVGTGNLNDHMMETLADKGNGQYSYLDSLDEADKVLVREMAGTLYTIAKDVKIQIEFNPMRVGAYRLIGYDNRTLAREDFEDDTKDAGELGAGHSVTALYELVPPGAEGDAVAEGEEVEEVPADERAAMQTAELAHVRLRYKEPDADVSGLVEDVLEDSNRSLWAASEDFRFVAAVAQFGLMLGESQYQGNSSWKSVLDLAKSAVQLDTTGDRAEFVTLAIRAKELSEQKLASK